MENASKALLIAGGILISMLVLSIGVYLFMTYSGLKTSYEQNLETNKIQQFNVNFLKFEGRNNITIQEIVSLANFAKDYNEKIYEPEEKIKVIIQGEGDLAEDSYSSESLTGLIKDDINNAKYKATIEPYDKLIKKIIFTKL